MLRRTAFCLALSALVFAGEFTSHTSPGSSSTAKITQNKQLPKPARRVPASTQVPSLQVPSSQVPSLKSSELEKSVFEQINRYRAAKGLSKLRLNANISKQARVHSQNMANGKVPFSHQGFERRVNAMSITYRSAAENVAYNLGFDDPVAEAVRGWIKSPGHLKNIKGTYNLTGIGVASNSKGEVYLTQIFLTSP